MRRRMFAALVALSSLSHCARKPAAIAERDEEPLVTPQPPERVNCVLQRGMTATLAPAKGGDATVVARFKRSTRYSKTRRGDWDYMWHLVVYDVVRVERGSWAERQLVFAASDRWPVRGSHMRVKKAMYPFRKGTIYAFALDSSEGPAQILGTDERSRLPPHGPVVRPSLAERAHMKVAEAAMGHVAGWVDAKSTPAHIVEETDKSYIVEIGHAEIAGSDIWLLAVDKKTLAVEPLPEPAPERKLRRCPNGHTTIKLVPIVYGMIEKTPETLKREENYQVAYGGCCVGKYGKYKIVCTTCGCHTYEGDSPWFDKTTKVVPSRDAVK